MLIVVLMVSVLFVVVLGVALALVEEGVAKSDGFDESDGVGESDCIEESDGVGTLDGDGEIKWGGETNDGCEPDGAGIGSDAGCCTIGGGGSISFVQITSFVPSHIVFLSLKVFSDNVKH